MPHGLLHGPGRQRAHAAPPVRAAGREAGRRIALSSLRLARACAQWLHRPGTSPAEIVRHLLAVQAQDARAAALALRARGTGFGAAGAGEGLVRAWLVRGTLHLVTREDWAWLLPLTAPGRIRAGARRLAQLGVAPQDADRLARVLDDEGPLTREELGDRTGFTGPPLHHLMARVALQGLAVLEGDRFVRVAPPPPLDRPVALAELARRYLAGHGPATAADLAGWAGLPLRDARAGLDAIAPSLVQDGGLVDLAGREPPPEGVGPRLLPAFDPYLLGWRDRSFAVPAALRRRVHPGGGMLRATATVDGLAVGTWSAKGLDVPDPAIFEAERADVSRFLG